VSHESTVSNLLPSQEAGKSDLFSIESIGRLALLAISIRYRSHFPIQFRELTTGLSELAPGPIAVARVARFCGGAHRWLFISPVE
jgi:hypothetical protein